jgi:hypothetical protein
MKLNRILSIIIVLVLLCAGLPSNVLAEETGMPESSAPQNVSTSGNITNIGAMAAPLAPQP